MESFTRDKSHNLLGPNLPGGVNNASESVDSNDHDDHGGHVDGDSGRGLDHPAEVHGR
jgi:hypothetical protein